MAKLKRSKSYSDAQLPELPNVKKIGGQGSSVERIELYLLVAVGRLKKSGKWWKVSRRGLLTPLGPFELDSRRYDGTLAF
jgi:hypothetical protein